MEITELRLHEFSTSRRSLPYIDYVPEFLSGDPDKQKIPQGFAAYIGCRIIPKEFAVVEDKRWGFSREALIEEVQRRQRDFLQSFREKSYLNLEQSPVNRTLSLRFIYDPYVGEVQICLVGKVLAPTKAAARQGAMDLWQEMNGLIPYDYHLSLLTTRDAFYESSGKGLLENAYCPNDIVEIRRAEELVYSEMSNAYVLSSWNVPPLKNEQVWRAMAASNERVMLAVTLQPTELTFMERAAISELADAAEKTAENTPYPLLQRKAKRAAESLAEKVTGWETPFLLQLHLVAPGGVPDCFVGAVGSMLKTEADVDAFVESYRLVQSHFSEQVRVVNRRLRTMMVEKRPSEMPDIDVARFPLLFGLKEAQSVFRLPFLPKGGIPGLSFGSASFPNGRSKQLPLGV